MPNSNTDLARRVVCNAHDYNRVQSVITDSWMRLKAAHGHPIIQDRLELLSRINVITLPAPTTPTARPSLASDLADRKPRVSQRIAARLAQLKSA